MKIDLTDLKAQLKALSKTVDLAIENATDVGRQSAIRNMQAYIKDRGRVDTGSWMAEASKRIRTKRSRGFIAEINIDTKRGAYSDYKNFGTRPTAGSNMLRYSNMTDWVIRKGLASDEKEAERIAFAIALKAIKGTEYNKQMYGISPSSISWSGGKPIPHDRDIYNALIEDLMNDKELIQILERW